jgi:hypothetical protein
LLGKNDYSRYHYVIINGKEEKAYGHFVISINGEVKALAYDFNLEDQKRKIEFEANQLKIPFKEK